MIPYEGVFVKRAFVLVEKTGARDQEFEVVPVLTTALRLSIAVSLRGPLGPWQSTARYLSIGGVYRPL